MDLLKLILTSLFSAVSLFVITKTIGHKQVAQLDFFDYVTGITIGSIGAEMATELDNPWKPLVAMVIYGIISVVLTFVARKLPHSRKYINGAPAIIMSGGKLYRKNMKKSKLELSEFMVMCRQQGFFNIADIDTAVFEYNGHLTIIPIGSKKPLTPQDVNISVKQETICTEIIMDGKILHENIKRLGFNPEWLQKQLKSQNYNSAKDVFLGIYDGKNSGFYPKN